MPQFNSKPLHIILSTGSSVNGITSLGDELFVIRHYEQQIDVYDASNFTLLRRIPVPSRSRQSSLAACPVNNCIYMSVYVTNAVHRIDLTGREAIRTWDVPGTPFGLSVTAQGSVLVACSNDNSIREYTTEGLLMREIPLHQSPVMSVPLCAVQLPRGDQLGVTINANPRYCVVDSAAGTAATCRGQFGTPVGIAVDTRSRAYVADYSRNKIAVLEPDAQLSASYLQIDGGVSHPYYLHIDRSRGRLYIGENGGTKRVVVLEM